MSQIRLLDKILISKIAAGEVVERPAAALKELLENSIDAGAERISVELEAGGKRLIGVSDDGCGMSREDAVMSIERHTTSKISDESDLEAVETFGFRGEALASIAAVSRFSLKTRARGETAGTEVSVEGGNVTNVSDSGCPDGTTVTARSLFFNTRPRLKFLKTDETELSRAVAVVRAAAVANPDVGFEVSHNGKNLFRLPPADIEQRVADVVGKAALYPFGFSGGGKTEVSGFVCAPADGFSSMDRLYCHVNGRYVRDRFLNRILMDGFGRVFEKGRYPQGAIFVTVAPDEVDVNVHPAKREVRFLSPGAVAAAVKSAVAAFLSSAPWLKPAAAKSTAPPAAPPSSRPFSEVSAPRSYAPAPRLGRSASRPAAPASAPVSETLPLAALESGGGFFSGLNIVGQAGGLYIVCESPDGIILIDQHAAHERVNFEKFKNAYTKDGKIPAQRLLVPDVVEMRPGDAALFSRFRGKMEAMGLAAEEFGDGAARLLTVPALVSCSDGARLFVDTLAALDESDCPEETGAIDAGTENVLATMACHDSIRAGYSMGDKKEIRSLLAAMDGCESPNFCPHGRPVCVHLSHGDLEKMFKRK
ncbi:MAG: DNA mismatch repair endonuclease MutL [Candidatus Dadabacteria bacterium]|nr:DNA mismatch repair endonuclease MutL [Candidatus Dadabacteria bacterium]